MESTLYGIFTLIGFVSEISLVRFQILHQTRVKIPYARAFHEVISMYSTQSHGRSQSQLDILV